MKALNNNYASELLDLPQGNKVVGCKWIFAIKIDPDGSVAWLKARLVIKRYAQTYKVDYSDTFFSYGQIDFCLFISISTSHHWLLHQLDIKNTFLHDNPQEKVNMKQPLIFVAHEEYVKVYNLKKSLYDLKQNLVLSLAN